MIVRGQFVANYSILVGCPAPESELRSFEETVRALSPYGQPTNDGWGPLLIGRYSLPLFWLAGFESSNVIRLSIEAVDPQGDNSVLSYIGACTTAQDFIERINQRRQRLSSILPDTLASSYSAVIDEWVDYIRDRFPDSVLLNPYEIPFLVGASFDSLFAQAIDAVSRFGATPGVTLDAGGQLGLLPDLRPHNADVAADAVRAGLFGYCDAEGAFWPPNATSVEIEYFGR